MEVLAGKSELEKSQDDFCFVDLSFEVAECGTAFKVSRNQRWLRGEGTTVSNCQLISRMRIDALESSPR